MMQRLGRRQIVLVADPLLSQQRDKRHLHQSLADRLRAKAGLHDLVQ